MADQTLKVAFTIVRVSFGSSFEYLLWYARPGVSDDPDNWLYKSKYPLSAYLEAYLTHFSAPGVETV